MSIKNYTKLKYDGFEKHLTIHRRIYDGWRWQFEFENGWAVSVIKNRHSYGGKDDLFESMLYKRDEFFRGEVFGGMSNNEVLELLRTTKDL